MTYFNLSNRKALITGAGQGMGFGIAKALADHGATATPTDRVDPSPTAIPVMRVGFQSSAVRLGSFASRRIQ